MNNNDEFFIGYQEKPPAGHRRFIKKWVFIILGVVLLVAILFSTGQAPFVNSTFELGSLREINGIFYHAPYPMLRIKLNEDHVKDIVLVGFGKFGADEGFQSASLREDYPQDGSILTLNGTLIYYDGKALFQLQPNLDGNYHISGKEDFEAKSENHGLKVFEGEIVDPKCYFGVMKPGFGKIHRSCATRCISGGIPPVFVTTNTNGHHEYYILSDKDGNKLGEEVLQYIGKPSRIKGELYLLGEWYQMRIDPNEIETLNLASAIYE